MTSLRKWLLTGLLVIVPLAITFWVLNGVVSTLDQVLDVLPKSWHPTAWIGYNIPGLGAILVFLFVLVVGALTSNFVGKRLMTGLDSVLNRIPVVRSVYSGVKQVSDTLFSDSGNAFRKAVLVQWPREGVWTLAFLTSTPSGEIAHHIQGDYITVYVPTTPNPTSGYIAMVPKSSCIELSMSVDEALKHIVSMGVIGTDKYTPPSTPPEKPIEII